MATEIIHTGKKFTVEIPEELVTAASLPVGEPMEWIANGKGSAILVRPSAPSADKSIDEMTLEELLEGVEEGTSLGEFDWGPPRGAEVW